LVLGLAFFFFLLLLRAAFLLLAALFFACFLLFASNYLLLVVTSSRRHTSKVALIGSFCDRSNFLTRSLSEFHTAMDSLPIEGEIYKGKVSKIESFG
jgi:hypothetical protein